LLHLPLPPPLRPTLFPYTTLFRSSACSGRLVPGCRLHQASFERIVGGWHRGRRPSSALAHPNHPPINGLRKAPSTRATTWSRGADRKSTRLNSSHVKISYAVFCLK